MWRVLGIFLVLVAYAAMAHAQQKVLAWRAPTSYTSKAPYDVSVTPPTYKIYVGQDAQSLAFVLQTPPLPEVWPSIRITDIGLDPGECVAVSAVSASGVESAQSAPYCYEDPFAPDELHLRTE